MDNLINFEYYKIFYYVAKEGNITRASEKLYISQPAISQTIKKLEEELGLSLFARNKKGVVLTKSGQKIFEKVENAILNFSSAQKIAEEEKSLLGGELIIGCGSNIARRLLPLPLQRFVKANQNIEVIQLEEVQAKMFKMLSKGELDLILSQENKDIQDFPFFPLSQEEYIFVKARGANEEDLKLIKLSDGSYAQFIFNDYLKKHPKKLREIKVSGYIFAIELALCGVGIALTPKYLVEDKLSQGLLEQVYIDFHLPPVTFGYYYNSDLITPATKEFIKYLENCK